MTAHLTILRHRRVKFLVQVADAFDVAECTTKFFPRV